jgi:hypothetical protein
MESDDIHDPLKHVSEEQEEIQVFPFILLAIVVLAAGVYLYSKVFYICAILII